MTAGIVKKLQANIWERAAEEHYVEPFWVSERLFDVERFQYGIWDPCCGFGRICDSALRSRIPVCATDIVDRGYKNFGGMFDFLCCPPPNFTYSSIMCNPPFNLAQEFAERALATPHIEKIAMIFPTARLNAARWLQKTPLIRIWLLTPRPSMPPGSTITAGEKPGGGKMDFCWLVWDRSHSGPASIQWLHRDKRKQHA